MTLSETDLARIERYRKGIVPALRLLAVADLPLLGDDPERTVRAALRGGATMIQLRAKNAPARIIVEAARRIVPACREAAAPLVINDRPDIALAVGADGVHVGPDDLPPPDARRVAGRLLLGVTARDAGRLALAGRAAADYVGLGAWRTSETKPEASVTGTDVLAALIGATVIPAVLIGGIRPEDAPRLRAAGAAGAAVAGGIFGASDVEAAARAYRAAWDSASSTDASN